MIRPAIKPRSSGKTETAKNAAIRACEILARIGCTVEPSEVFTDARRRAVVLARAFAWRIMREETRFSLEQIGRDTGGYEATTVGQAIRTLNQDFKSEFSLARVRDFGGARA